MCVHLSLLFIVNKRIALWLMNLLGSRIFVSWTFVSLIISIIPSRIKFFNIRLKTVAELNEKRCADKKGNANMKMNGAAPI